MRCVNSQALSLDFRKSRNNVYKNHRCYYNKDQAFVDKLLLLDSKIVSAVLLFMQLTQYTTDIEKRRDSMLSAFLQYT